MIDCKDLVGIPFKEKGRDKTGLDCYGLVLMLLKKHGIDLPDFVYTKVDYISNNQVMQTAEKTIPNMKLDSPQELCIIEFSVYGLPSHVGVYIGEGFFIHASRSSGMVCIEKLSKWKKKVVGYYDVKNNPV